MGYIKKFNEFINEGLESTIDTDVINELGDDLSNVEQRILERFNELFTPELLKEFTEELEYEMQEACTEYVDNNSEYEEPGSYKIHDDDYDDYGGLICDWDDFVFEYSFDDKSDASPELEYLGMYVYIDKSSGIIISISNYEIDLDKEDYKSLYALVEKIYDRSMILAEHSGEESHKEAIAWEKQKQELMHQFI